MTNFIEIFEVENASLITRLESLRVYRNKSWYAGPYVGQTTYFQSKPLELKTSPHIDDEDVHEEISRDFFKLYEGFFRTSIGDGDNAYWKS